MLVCIPVVVCIYGSLDISISFSLLFSSSAGFILETKMRGGGSPPPSTKLGGGGQNKGEPVWTMKALLKEHLISILILFVSRGQKYFNTALALQKG